MVRTPDDEFSRVQVSEALDANWKYVQQLWREEFRQRQPHYICDGCRFVSDKRNMFEVDHVVPVARGGTRDLVSRSLLDAIALQKVEALYDAGSNLMILCKGCNQAKKARQFIPPGAGYAYRLHDEDRNPDHMYHGAPKVSPREVAEHPEIYNPRRYR